MGKLYFRYSAMNSGKTTQLIQVKHNYEERCQNVLVLKPSVNKRDGVSNIKSRRGIECQAFLLDDNADIFVTVKLSNEKRKTDCVLVD